LAGTGVYMNLKKAKRITDILYILSIIFAVAIVLKNYFDKSKLPEGFCPVRNNMQYMIGAIVLLVIAFMASTIIDYMRKKQNTNKNGN